MKRYCYSCNELESNDAGGGYCRVKGKTVDRDGFCHISGNILCDISPEELYEKQIKQEVDDDDEMFSIFDEE